MDPVTISPVSLIIGCSAVVLLINLASLVLVAQMFKLTVAHQIDSLEARLKSWVHDVMKIQRKEIEQQLSAGD